MKVLLAGATGAIGRPLITALQDAGHDVVALTRNPVRGALFERTGVEVVVADALDRDALLQASRRLRIDAVIHQMTALSKPPARHSGMVATNTLRTTGTRNLLEVAGQAGASRFLTQSIVFGYGYSDHGTAVVTEDMPFGRPDGGRTAPHVESMGVNERLVVESTDVDGIALRYGLFYSPEPAMRDMLQGRKVPVPSASERTLAWIHIDDAVSATLAALERGRPGAAYNVVDDEPASWRTMVTAMAAAYGAPAPRTLPSWVIRLAAPYVAAMVLDTSMRVSNAKARAELGWEPAYPTFRDGARSLVTVGS